MFLNEERARAIIQLPNLKKFIGLSDGERKHLGDAIAKIKLAEMHALVTHLSGILLTLELSCYRCVLVSKPTIPSQEDLKPFKQTESSSGFSAYIRVQNSAENHLYYLDNTEQQLIKIEKIGEAELSSFDAKLKPATTQRLLSDNELKEIKSLTGTSFEDDRVTLEKMIPLITFSAIKDAKILRDIFKVQYYETNKQDPQLAAAINELNLKKAESDSLFNLLWDFRHLYMLDKYSTQKVNRDAFKMRKSECWLEIGHKNVSKFFYTEYLKDHTKEEQAVLQKVYPLESLKKKKIFRREAHLDIALTLTEIHSVIQGALDYLLQHGQRPVEYSPIPLSSQTQYVLNEYTQSDAVTSIAAGNLNEFKDKYASIVLLDYYSGMTLLAHAVKLQQLEFVNYFLERGISTAKHPDLTGYTSLHYAVEGNNEKIFSSIISVSDVNAQDRGGYTPIYVASELGQEKYVAALLEKGADPNLARNRFHSTALHVAVRSYQKEVVKVLLDSKKVNTDLQDIKMNTAEQLAKFKSKEIYELIKKYDNPFISSQNKTITALPPKVVSTALSNQKVLLNKTQLEAFLLNPKMYEKSLTDHRNSLINASNPFPIVHIQRITRTEPVHKSFCTLLVEEQKIPVEAQAIFSLYVGHLKSLAFEKTTFARCYSRIIKIIEKLQSEQAFHYSHIAFAFEIYRQGFLKHLINLQENKTPLQIAIEGEELDTIEEFLNETPKCSSKINYKNELISEFDYAIRLGKTKVVEHMLGLMQKNTEIDLGLIPNNALAMVQEKEKEISSRSLAFKEADTWLNIDVPKSSRKNIKRLLRNLMKTKGDKVDINTDDGMINGLFTKEEYKVVSVLIGEKEAMIRGKTSLSRPSFSARLILRQIKGLTLLKKRKLYLETNNANFSEEQRVATAEELKFIDKYLNKLESPSYLAENYARWKKFHIPPSYPQLINVFRHATDHYDAIAKDRKLIPVAKAIANGAKSGTPVGTRENIFFSVAKSITPFRNKSKNIIEVRVVELMREQNISPQMIIYTAHIPAFEVERVEARIIFIGSDPNKKTILTIYHTNREKGNCKIYCFDYYESGKHIGNKFVTYKMDEEFFLGDNVKITAYRIIELLRNYIKGPFEKSSYYDYILENWNNIDILESAKAALINVLSTEGKITTDITVDHPSVLNEWRGGVKVTENPKNKSTVELSFDAKAELINSLLKGESDSLPQLIRDKGIAKEQLWFLLIGAIKEQKKSAIIFLLDYGVSSILNNNEALRVAIDMLEKMYHKNNRDLKSAECALAYEIVDSILTYGFADENDPKHIRYGSSPANFSKPPIVTWTNLTQNDLLALKQFIFKFDHVEIHTLLLSNVTKHFLELSNFMLDYAYFELYKFLVASNFQTGSPYFNNNSVVQKGLFYRQTLEPLIQKIDKGEIDFVLESLDKVNSLEMEKYYGIFSYAVRKGCVPIVAKYYPIFRNSLKEKLYPSLHMAIRFNQTDVLNKLLELGASLNEENTLHENAFAVAFKYSNSAVIDLIGTSGDITDVLIAAIEHSKLDLINKFAEKITIPQQSFSEYSLPERFEEVFKPMLAAIKKNDEKILNILVKTYSKKIPTKRINAHFIYLATIHAVHNFAEVSRNFLLRLIVNNNSLCKTIFLSSKQLFVHIAAISNLDDLKSALEIIKLKPAVINHETKQGNCLDAVSRLGLEKFKLIHENSKSLKVSSVENLFMNICMSNDPVPFFDYVVDNGFLFPENIDVQMKILAKALTSSKETLIKRMFEKNVIEAKYSSPTGLNILQLLFAHLKKMPYMKGSTKISDKEKFHATLKYLCTEVGLDVNHGLNKQLLILEDLDKDNPYIREFQTFLLMFEKTNLTVRRDENGATVLHIYEEHEKFTDVIDRYIQQQGDINAKNNEGYTPLDSMMLYGDGNSSCVRESILKMRRLRAQASSYLPCSVLRLGVITCTLSKQRYVLVRDASSFLHEIQEEREGFDFTTENKPHDQAVTFTHVDIKPVNNKLPTASRIFLKNKRENYVWLKMPTQYQKQDDGTFIATIDSHSYTINALTEALLQHIIKQNGVKKEDRKFQYYLSKEQYQWLVDQATQLRSELQAIYEPFFLHKDILPANKIKLTIERVAFPLPIYVAGNGLSSERYLIYSPLVCAVLAGNLKALESLAKDSNAFRNCDYPLHILAVSLRYPDILRHLISKNDISVAEVTSCFSMLTMSLKEDFEIATILLDHALKMKFFTLLQRQDLKNSIDTAKKSLQSDKYVAEHYQDDLIAFNSKTNDVIAYLDNQALVNNNATPPKKRALSASLSSKKEVDGSDSEEELNSKKRKTNNTHFFKNKRLRDSKEENTSKRQKRDPNCNYDSDNDINLAS